jgi:hypothetical protein
MNLKEIQKELDNISKMSFAKRTDKQLASYEILSTLHKLKNEGKQPTALAIFNRIENRKCKLTPEKVKEIRSKYNPYIYGKQRLSLEYGVSASVIYRIVKGKSWKI